MEKFNRYVVVSTSNNPDYYFYAKYVEHAWNKLGWELCIMITYGTNPLDLELQNPNTVIVQLPNIPGIREETIAQAGRLYAANYLPHDKLIMTSDIDLLPLSDYWNPGINNVTIYGHDLTWRTFYPMGYCAMSGANWFKNLQCTYNTAEDLERDVNEIGMARSKDWEQWWNHDWTLLTKRLKPLGNDLTFIDRGQIHIAGAHLAKGRIDRYNWAETQKQEVFIDAHCENINVKHPVKLEPFLQVFNKFYDLRS